MDEDNDTLLTFDEVAMQDMIDDWSRNYEPGIEVGGWYYDCNKQTVLIRLLIPALTDTAERSE